MECTALSTSCSVLCTSRRPIAAGSRLSSRLALPRGASVPRPQERAVVLRAVAPGGGPDPDKPDFWENPAFDGLGQVLNAAIPVLVVAAVLVGLFAAKTYNSDVTAFVLPATSETEAQIIPATPSQ